MFYLKNELLIIQSQWWPQSSSSEVVGTMFAMVTFRRFGHWLWRISTILGLTCVPSKLTRERLSDFKQDTPTKSRLLMWKFNTSTPKMYSNPYLKLKLRVLDVVEGAFKCCWQNTLRFWLSNASPYVKAQ